MPWQAYVADVGTEILPDGRPAFDQVVVSVPRQQGKTVLAKTIVVERGERLPDQCLVYTAQNRIAARKRVLATGRDLQRQKRVKRVREAIGSELVEWENGSQLEVVSPTASGGHGDTIDLAVLDELWKLQMHVLQGIEPARIARPLSQMWGISTMGTDESDVLNHFVEIGREAVNDPESRLAYFEWSMDPETDDLYDPKHWWRWMPALGRTVTVEAIQAKLATMPRGEALRAFGNVRSRVDEAVIPAEWWEETEDVTAHPQQGMALAVDVNAGPSGVAIGACWEDDDVRTVGLVDYQAGASSEWVPRRLDELCARFRPSVVGLDTAGPATSVAADVRDVCERHGVTFREFRPRDLAAASGFLYDHLRERSIRHSVAEPLDLAVEGAVQKRSGDVWRFDRHNSPVDVSPLIAVSVALYAFHESKLTRMEPFIVRL